MFLKLLFQIIFLLITIANGHKQTLIKDSCLKYEKKKKTKSI